MINEQIEGRRREAKSDLVIAINESDQVLDVAPAADILDHIVGHRPKVPTKDPRQVAGDEPEFNVIDLYRADGEVLELVVGNDWHDLTLRPTGRYADLEQLRTRIQDVVDQRMEEIPPSSLGPMRLHPPVAEDWDGYLAETRGLVTGTSATFSGPDPFDRRGWFHNTFVHGGNP